MSSVKSTMGAVAKLDLPKLITIPCSIRHTRDPFLTKKEDSYASNAGLWIKVGMQATSPPLCVAVASIQKGTILYKSWTVYDKVMV